MNDIYINNGSILHGKINKKGKRVSNNYLVV